MKNIGYCIILAVLGAPLPQAQSAHEAAAPTAIEITADGENRYQGGIAYAEGNVVVHQGEDTIFADQVSFDKDKRELTARGNVRIFSDKKIYRGDFLIYNVDTKQIKSNEFRSSMDRIYAYGSKIDSPQPDVYIIRNGGITTDNRENPAYRIKAKTVEIYPDDRVVFKNVGIYVGSVPIMWLPYMALPLDQDKDNFDFTAGSSSRLGIYAVGSYTTAIDKRWSTTLHMGEFSRRGPGGGVDLNFDPRHGDHGELKTFFIHDNDPGYGAGTADRMVVPNEKRYRYDYKHKYQLSPDITTTADINIWSDKNLTQDFFPGEYSKQVQPDNFMDAVYYDPNFTATLLARSQFSNLFNVTERKPEFALDFKRQKLFDTPISYEGQSSVVNFSRRFDRDTGLNGYDAIRWDTFHQFSYPRQYFDWLSITPKLGLRGTEYSHNNDPSNPNPQKALGRAVVNGGVDASFKLSKTWSDIQNPGWGIDGLRHVFQPYMEAGYTNFVGASPSEVRGFDTRIPSTRLQPLDYSSFNSIDSVDKLASIKEGFRNKLQTRRDGQSYDLVNWDLYTQANLTHSVNQGILENSTFSEIYNDIAFLPVPWLNFNFYSATGVSTNSFNEIVGSVTWQVHPAVDVNVSYNHLNHVNYAYPNPDYNLQVDNSDYVTLQNFWRLNENWRVSQTLGFEAENGKLQEQSYTVYRDLTAWTAAMTAAMRNNGSQRLGDEFLVYFSLSLKAFPAATLKTAAY